MRRIKPRIRARTAGKALPVRLVEGEPAGRRLQGRTELRRDPSEQPLITETGLAPGLSEFAYGKLLHLASAVGALGNINRKHARQQLAPGQSMRTGLMGRLGLHLGLVFVTGHDTTCTDEAPSV